MSWNVLFALTVASVTLLARNSVTSLAIAQSPTWTVIPSPSQGTRDNNLYGIAAAAPTAVWAVGSYNAGPYTNSLRTLTERWNGTSWNIVPSPNPAPNLADYDSLQGVAAISPSNVWAVGYSGNLNAAADQTLTEQWDGTGWNIVPSANPYTSQRLASVAAISASDIWAVGQYANYNPYGQYGALTLHWNGTVWSEVDNPATSGLNGVTALASNNAWAVGYAQILHWDGTRWSIISSPQPPGGSYYQLQAVAAVSPTDIWAVGYVQISYFSGYIYHTLIEHWDGSSWTVVPGANLASTATYGDILYGVTALSATSVWAVGVVSGLSFVEQWDGTQWTRVSSPNIGSSNNTLQAAIGLPVTGEIWAGGEYYDTASSSWRTLVESTMTNPPQATNTPAATSTPTPTNLASATPTSTSAPTRTPIVTSTPTRTPTPTPQPDQN